MKSETRRFDRKGASCWRAKSNAARRLPRLAPSAMATLATVQYGSNQQSAINNRQSTNQQSTISNQQFLSFYPPHAQHPAAGAGAVGAAAEQIRSAGDRLLEEPLVFDRLTQNHAQQAAMAGVGQRVHSRPPFFDEPLCGVPILTNEP